MENYEARLLRLEKAIDGNGKPGISADIVELKTKFGNMEEALKDMATSLSGLAKSQLEHDLTEKFKAEMSAKKWSAIKHISTLAGITVSLISIIKFIEIMMK